MKFRVNSGLFLLAALGVLFVACTQVLADAECGDTNGDGRVAVSDALRTLRRAVDLPVELVCPSEPAENSVSFVNTLLCDNYGFVARLIWSEHLDRAWEAPTQLSFSGEVNNRIQVNDLELGGTLWFDLGECGLGVLDLDELGVSFPLPNHAGTTVMLVEDPSNGEIFVLINVQPRPLSLPNSSGSFTAISSVDWMANPVQLVVSRK